MLQQLVLIVTAVMVDPSTHYVFTDRIGEGGNAVASVHPSVSLFPRYLQNQLTIDLERLHVNTGWPKKSKPPLCHQ